jgi:hypothetical protein
MNNYVIRKKYDTGGYGGGSSFGGGSSGWSKGGGKLSSKN